MRDTDDKLLDTAQAAAYLGYSKSSLEMWRMQKSGPVCYRMGSGTGRIRYKQSDLDAYIESGLVKPKEA